MGKPATKTREYDVTIEATDTITVVTIAVTVEGATKAACKSAKRQSPFKNGKVIKVKRVLTAADGTKNYKK